MHDNDDTLRDEFLAISDLAMRFVQYEGLPPANKVAILRATATMFADLADTMLAVESLRSQGHEVQIVDVDEMLRTMADMDTADDAGEAAAIARARDLLR